MLLAACGSVEALLAGPYLLSTGLEAPSSLCPAPEGGFLVATREGAVHLDSQGHATPLGVPADRLTSTPEHLVFLHGATLSWQPTPGQAGGRGGHTQVVGATDILGWTADAVLVALPDAVWLVSLRDGARVEWAPAPGVTALALGRTEGEALAVRGDEVLSLRQGRQQRHRTGVRGLRQVAHDGEGRLWGLVDDTLVALEPDGPVLLAEHLGDPADLHAGAGDGFSPLHLYVADATGAVAFVPTPPLGAAEAPASRLAKPRVGR